jgi:hypothetical protein
MAREGGNAKMKGKCLQHFPAFPSLSRIASIGPALLPQRNLGMEKACRAPFIFGNKSPNE